jgi:protease-4
VEDLAQAFEAFRAQKRPVHCHFEDLDNAGYALASHCDRLSMSPAGTLNLVGLGAQVVHGRKLLELLGVRAELLQMGKYKGAAEPFTRDEMSPELQASLDGLLDDLDASFRGHLKKRAERTPEAWQAILDEGPYSANAARQGTLVDALSYDDEARAKAKTAAGARVVRHLFEKKEREPSLRDLIEMLGPGKHAHPNQPYVVLAHLTGEIVESEADATNRAASEPFVDAMRRWGDDRHVRAVVLRIESPGGSALASDRMWHAVRRVAGRKPVIVSLGDMAASGGYYVASAGTHIVAAPGSVVGSIGVVGGKMVIQDLADRVGVHVDGLKRAHNAAWLSPFAPFSDSERKLFEGMLEETYERFLDRVSIGRKRPVADLLPAAEGRVMGGERARKLGLVDEVGGLSRALSLAKQQGKLGPRAPVEAWPDERDGLRALASLLSAQAPQSVLDATVTQVMRVARPLAATPLLTILGEKGETVAATLPFVLTIR